MNRISLIRFWSLVFLTIFISSNSALAIEEKKWPDSISSTVEYLLAYSDSKNNSTFALEKCFPLLAFVSDPLDAKNVLYNDGNQSAPSAFYHFDIQRGLNEIIQYGFNPNISSVLLRPSSVRFSHWTEVNGDRKALPELWKFLNGIDAPVVVRGVEHIEITPDRNSGTYFSYDMNRTFILFEHQGKKGMISLSHQKKKSEVGKKGLILGPDENWDYVYTGEKGVNKRGLGWVRSHIYNSSNIMVFYENEPGKESVRCAVFNWIKAGWAGINMVNNEHIYNGIIRFANDFKSILENSALPEPNKLALKLARFEEMPTNELRNRARLYFERLEERYPGKEKQLEKLLDNPDYVKALRREEMVGMLIREYTKVLVGKESADKADYLLGHLEKPGQPKDELTQ